MTTFVAYALGMRIMPRAMRFGTALIALGLIMTACNLPGGTPEEPVPTATSTPVPSTPTPTPVPLAAFVNSQTISLEAFEREIARHEAAQTALGIDLATLGDYRAEVLSQLIDLSLLSQFATSHGMELTENELDSRLDEVVAARGGPAGMTTWLDSAGYTAEEFRSALRTEILAARTVSTITDSMPAEVEHTHARHILVATREEAEALIAQLADGASFSILAQVHSRDPSTGPGGGDLGWFPAGQLTMPEVDQAAFDLQPGEISEVIETELGFHVLEVLEREDRPLIGDALIRYRIAAVESWLTEQRERADIEILIESG